MPYPVEKVFGDVNVKSQSLLKGVGLNIVLLGIVSFINDASSDMIWPVLPMFIVSIGGGGLAVGLIGGLGESVSSVLKVFSGYWSDKIGKRKMLVASGYAISSISKIIFPFVTDWTQLLILKPAERIGKGIRTAPRDALIADSAPQGRYGKSFGLHRALDTSGAILGSFLAFILVWFIRMPLRNVLLIAAVLGFVALIPLIFVRDVKGKVHSNSRLMFELSSLTKEFKIFLMIVTIFALGNFSYMFLILKARGAFQMIFTEKMAEAIPILLYILFNLSYAAFSLPLGNLSDTIGKDKILFIGYLIFSLTCVGFVFSSTLYHFIILFLLYGLHRASVDAVQRALASDLAANKFKGTSLGVFHTLIGLAALPSSTIAGILWDINPSLTFAFGAATSIIAAVSLMLTLKP
ncbi:MFS transporter [Candidatus Bathyarchaeota archaeon]|nr:MAG: MFS transporter [Candidatus Bathyarchaeota archaeon]